MPTPPDSASTKHSLTMIQRQYIDSRFSESVADYMKSIIDALGDLSLELSNIRSKISMINYRLAKIEEAPEAQKDDKQPFLPLSLNQQKDSEGSQ